MYLRLLALLGKNGGARSTKSVFNFWSRKLPNPTSIASGVGKHIKGIGLTSKALAALARELGSISLAQGLHLIGLVLKGVKPALAAKILKAIKKQLVKTQKLQNINLKEILATTTVEGFLKKVYQYAKDEPTRAVFILLDIFAAIDLIFRHLPDDEVVLLDELEIITGIAHVKDALRSEMPTLEAAVEERSTYHGGIFTSMISSEFSGSEDEHSDVLQRHLITNLARQVGGKRRLAELYAVCNMSADEFTKGMQ